MDSAICISIYFCKCINRFIYAYMYATIMIKKRSYQLESEGRNRRDTRECTMIGRREDREEENPNP